MGTQSWKKGHGPLVPYAYGFRVRLLGMGHSQGSVKRHLVLMGQSESLASQPRVSASKSSHGKLPSGSWIIDARLANGKCRRWRH
jgi:hypothetical protein